VLFNSFPFLFFLPVVLIGYYVLGDFRKQNLWLLAASLVFYGSWDWRFLFLLAFTIVTDYFAARRIQLLRDEDRLPRQRQLLLTASILSNLGALAFFKYYNFFQANLDGVSSWLHLPLTAPVLNVILAIGISFFTFQSMRPGGSAILRSSSVFSHTSLRVRSCAPSTCSHKSPTRAGRRASKCNRESI
jgi:alginate O-acetyltransferase complex protein AlgI